jgi:undecaprenyl-diphosphatase
MDIQILLWLQGIRESLPAFVTTFFEAVSHIAQSKAQIFAIAILYWCFSKELGQRIVLSFSASALLNNFIKVIACAYRPWVREPALHPPVSSQAEATGYSFPSGHTQTATSIYGNAGVHAYRHGHRVVSALLWVFVALVAFSRNFLSCHTPQDVIVGLVEGIVVIAFVEWLVGWVDREPNRDLIVLVCALAVFVVTTAIAFLKGYPVDYDAAGNVLVDGAVMRLDFSKTAGMYVGVFLGWFLERRLIGFEVPEKKDLRQMAVRLVVGLAVLVVCYLMAKSLAVLGLPQDIYEMVRFFLILLAATFLSPLAFTKVEKRLQRPEPTLRR